MRKRNIVGGIILAAQLTGTGVVVVDVLPGLVRTSMTETMAAWHDVSDWDPVAATTTAIVDVARGKYDDRHGTTLNAIDQR